MIVFDPPFADLFLHYVFQNCANAEIAASVKS